MKLTPLENFRRLIRTGQAEWIPFTLDVGATPGFTGPAMARFRQQTGSQQPEEFFDYDFRTASLETHFGGDDPAVLHASVEPGTTFDEWGIGHWAGGVAGSYEKASPPLAGAKTTGDVESLPTPTIDLGRTFETVRDYHARGYPVLGYAGSVYEWSWWLRGMQEFMMYMAAGSSIAQSWT